MKSVIVETKPTHNMSFRSRNSGRALLPFGLDYSDIISQDQETEKPQLVLPINGPLQENEQVAAKRSISFVSLMTDGPFYTGTFNPNQEDTNPKPTNTAPDGIVRYSDKYKKVKKIGRTIEEHPYQIEFFPEELYYVMGISNKQKKKLISLSKFNSKGGLKEISVEKTEDDQASNMLERLKSMAEELDNGDEKDDEEDELEDDVDDEFDEDDDDDYNAEKYFDDGDDDAGDAGGDDEAAF